MDVVIDGRRYVSADDSTTPERGTIGIAITTRNRPDTVKKTYSEIRRFTPQATIWIVDDASNQPLKESDFQGAKIYRFNENVGIATAKNKSLELLIDDRCDHLFLFDDDCYPKVEKWYEPYINSPEPHLSHSFDLVEIYRDKNIVATHAVGGSMIYYEAWLIRAVGGMRTEFGKWGCEHVNLSDRIFNSGFTSWRYQDIPDAYDGKIFYELDRYEKGTHKTTATKEQVKFNQEQARPYWATLIESDTEHIDISDNFNVVMTSYITGTKDPQRSRFWKPQLSDLEKLANSIKFGRLVVFHDCFDNPQMKTGNGKEVEFIKVDKSHMNVYFRRHLLGYQYLRAHPEIQKAWEVDATDVEMLRNPFLLEDGFIYLGWEPSLVGNAWLKMNHPDERVQKFIAENSDLQLLNAGLIGGFRDMVLKFLSALQRYYVDNQINRIQGWHGAKEYGVGDMGGLNYIAYTKFKDKIKTGTQVATVFKAEKVNEFSWWRHK